LNQDPSSGQAHYIEKKAGKVKKEGSGQENSPENSSEENSSEENGEENGEEKKGRKGQAAVGRESGC